MGEFGWAYISGSAPIQSAGGVSGSIQFATDASNINGSDKFVFKNESNIAELTGSFNVLGNINVAGDITASNFVIENVTEIDSAGSSKFGNSNDDIHRFTGSVDIAGALSSSNNISASSFYGDGSNLTGLSNAAINTYNSAGETRLITSVNSTTVKGESALTWHNSVLVVTGTVMASNTIKGLHLSGSGANVHSINASNISAGTLNNARLPASIDVSSLTGALGASNLIGTINNARLPNSINVSSLTGALGASNLIGTINNDRLPFTVSITDLTASNHVSSSVIYGNTGNFTSGLTIGGDTIITGSLTVSGSVYANEVITNVVNKNVTTISSTGSTTFGDTSDDTHRFTGAVVVDGDLSASTNTSASAFYGDGSTLSNITFQAVSNPGQYRILTNGASSTDVEAESGLRWIGSVLQVTGTVSASNTLTGFFVSGSDGKFGTTTVRTLTASSYISASAFYGNGANLTGIVGGTQDLNNVLSQGNSSSLSITVGDVTGSGLKLTGLTAGTATTSSFLALDSNNNVVLTSSAGGNVRIMGTSSAGQATDITAVTKITFDGTTGLNVTASSATEAIVSLGSHFNPIQVTGQDTLQATGSEALEIAAGSGISLTTNKTSTPKKLTITAIPAFTRAEITSSTTSSTSYEVLGVNATGALEIRLPGASTYATGQYFTVKDEAGNANTHNITIRASGSQTIDGSNSIVLESPHAAVNIYCNGTDKFFIY